MRSTVTHASCASNGHCVEARAVSSCRVEVFIVVRRESLNAGGSADPLLTSDEGRPGAAALGTSLRTTGRCRRSRTRVLAAPDPRLGSERTQPESRSADVVGKR